MRLNDLDLLAKLPELAVEHLVGASTAARTSLGIGGPTDILQIRQYQYLPDLIALLKQHGVSCRLLGGGSNLLIQDGELPWVLLHLAPGDSGVRVEDGVAYVDAAADLGGTVTYCAKRNLGGLEGLIGVPGTVGGALRMNAGAYGTQIGTWVREVKLLRAASGQIEILRGDAIRFEYRHTSFAPDDIMLAVKLALPSKSYSDILQGIRVCNEKRRASQPLNQKSAGCIFKNPPGGSAGRMIDELGLKGLSVGDARVSDRHANFFINAGSARCADMLALIEQVRERVHGAFGVTLETEVILWTEV
jgi:UDP-N-acetylmuramate dehydrogenase